MSLPDTDNTDDLFLTARPSWEERIVVNQMFPSKIFTARSGLEQRQAERSKPSWKMEYKHHPGSHAAARLRLRRLTAEMAAALIVPWWPDEYQSANTAPTGSGSFLLNTDPQPDFFEAGEYVCFDGTGGLQFRAITAIAGRSITLGGTGLAHAAGTRVWPCKRCLRSTPDASLYSDLTAEEKIVVVSLQ